MATENHDSNAMIEHFKAAVANTEFTFENLQESLKLKQPEIVPNDLSGKIAIVTGANVGIGYEAAKAIASMNAKKIILACRNEEKALAAIEKIKKETGFKNELEFMHLDLASFKSVNEFTQKFLNTNLPLDILVSNAGVIVGPVWAETEDGHEITTQVNHLSNVLLVSNLYPALQRAADKKKEGEEEEEKDRKFPRVVVVASDVHAWSTIQPEDPHPLLTALKKRGPEELTPTTTYSTSKLFNVLFAKAFAKRVKDKRVWICSANPGLTSTEFGSKDPLTGVPHGRGGFNLLPPRSQYEGAKSIIHAAISPSVGKSGGYYSDVKETETRTSTRGEQGEKFADNLWVDTIEVLKKQNPSSPIYDW